MSMYSGFSEKEREILRARMAQRLTGEQDKLQGGEMDTALTVQIRQELYAMPVTMLTYVHTDVPIVPMPCVPPHIAGIANIRGHIIPVLDTGVLLSVPGTSNQEAKNTLVVATNSEMTVAFMVETIGDILTFPTSAIAPVPTGEDERAKAYLQGILPGGETLLNIDAILDDPSLNVLENIT